jgi:hypothetical protein
LAAKIPFEGEKMSEELQIDAPAEISDSATIENPAESGAELATETETTEQTQTPEQIQAAKDRRVQDAINKQHKKYRDEERKRIQIENQLKESQKKLQEFESQNAVIDIPEMPDPYDDDFEQKVRERDNLIQQKAAFEAQQSYALQQQQAQQQQQQMQEQQKLDEQAIKYAKRAAEMGISSQELQQAGNVVAEYQLPDTIVMGILNDPEGGLITKYLASNPLEIDNIRQLDPFSAATYINQNVRPKAAELKPKTSNTPQPASTVSGGGADPDGDRYWAIKGAKFE